MARGDKQIKGKDFKHTFSPVARFTTIRVIITLAAAKQWHLHQLDINDAFLHGYINEEIYMSPTPGYTKALPGQVCRLKRSLYGLKQAARQWNIELCKFLLEYGFVQSSQDSSMFMLQQGDQFTIVVAYVDDLLVTGSHLSTIVAVKAALHKAFTIKDLGELKYFLGIEVTRTVDGISLNQRKYILDMLKDSSMTNCHSTKFNLQKGLKLSLTEGEVMTDPEIYRRLVGKLLYLNMTRPGISYVVQQLSQFMHDPRVPHFSAAI